MARRSRPAAVTRLLVAAAVCAAYGGGGAAGFLLRRAEIARLASVEPPPPEDFADAVQVPSPYARDGGRGEGGFDEVLLCTNPQGKCPDFAVLLPREDATAPRLPVVTMLYPLFGMDAGTWARTKDAATLARLASHGFAVAYSLHHPTSGVRACAMCHGLEAYVMHGAHPVMGLNLAIALSYNASLPDAPSPGVSPFLRGRSNAGSAVPAFPDPRVTTLPYDPSGAAAKAALAGRIDAHRMGLSGFSVGGAIAASVARACAVLGQEVCGLVRFKSIAALAPTPGLPAAAGGVGTRESMADLSGASSLAALVVAGENDRMGATNDGVDFIYGALNDSPRASVLIRNASHCFVAVPPSIECGVNPVETTLDAFSPPPLPNPYFPKQINTARMLLAQWFTATLGDASRSDVAQAASDVWTDGGALRRAASSDPWHPLSADVLALRRLRRSSEIRVRPTGGATREGSQRCVPLQVETTDVSAADDGASWHVGVIAATRGADAQAMSLGGKRRSLKQADVRTRWVSGGSSGSGQQQPEQNELVLLKRNEPRSRLTSGASPNRLTYGAPSSRGAMLRRPTAAIPSTVQQTGRRPSNAGREAVPREAEAANPPRQSGNGRRATPSEPLALTITDFVPTGEAFVALPSDDARKPGEIPPHALAPPAKPRAAVAAEAVVCIPASATAARITVVKVVTPPEDAPGARESAATVASMASELIPFV